MKLRSVRWIAASALLFAAPSTARGQQSPRTPADSLPEYLLEGLVVTSRRSPAARENLPQNVEIITRSDLDRTVGADLTDALKRNAGVDVVQYPGLLSGVSVRGFRPQFSGINPRMLILVDGRPAGVSNLSLLDVAGVQRVEVLKGPASALYGSSAMAGVINVVTNRNTGGVRGRATARYGSFGSYRGELSMGGNVLPGLDFDLAVATYGQSRGYEVGSNRLISPDSVTKTLRDGTTLRVAELAADTALAFSRFAYRTGSLRLGYALGEEWRIDARGDLSSADDVENPGDLTAPYDSRSMKDLGRYAGDVALTGSIGAHSLVLRAYTAQETAGYYNAIDESRFVSFRTPTRWYGAQLQDAFSFGRGVVTAGLDYGATEANSEAFQAAGQRAAPYSPNSAIRSAAAFTETRLEIVPDRLFATLGGRLDRVVFSIRETELLPDSKSDEEAQTVFNPSAGLLYRPLPALRLHASAGRAFVNPDAFYMVGYAESPAGAGAVRVTRGNPELSPESSVSWDGGIGFQSQRAGLEADLTYFHTDVRDRITARPVAPAPGERTTGGDLVEGVTTYVNVDRAVMAGLEGHLSYDLAAAAGYPRSLRLFLNGTRLLRAEETLAGANAPIYNVADLNAVFGLDYDDLRRWGGRLSGRYVGERTDADWSDFTRPGDVRYPAFLVFDLSGSMRVRRYRLGVLLGNLTDENYYEVRGYNLPGRSVQLQVGLDF